MIKLKKILLLVTLLLVFLPYTSVSAAADPVVVLEINGVINPFSARYLERGLQLVEDQGAQLVVITLDTPGGLESAMREMIESILSAPMPVVVFVTPEGARATSAGLFLLSAGDIAAMSPATHAGAATPVALGQELEDVMQEKAISDASALIRSLAEKHGRNADWLERAVRESLSLTASEALAENVIDLIADDLDALLMQLDGREVRGSTLALEQVQLNDIPMNLLERFFHVITNPNIAYLLISLGTLLLLTEISDPGLSFAGIGAVLTYIIGFMALGSLPINWAAVLLLVLSFIMFIVALFTDTEAIVTTAGLIPFVIGSLLLFTPLRPSSIVLPDLRVSPWLIVLIALGIAAFSLVVLRAILKASKRPPQMGAERFIGMQAQAQTVLDPNGEVLIEHQLWSATCEGTPAFKGEAVEVVAVSGVRLIVRRPDQEA